MNDDKNHWIQQSEKRHPMGIGHIGQPNMVFVRKFRWALEASNLGDHFIKNVKLDFHRKLVEFDCYECYEDTPKPEIEIQKWAESDISKEVMTFTTFDGCGASLYQYKFIGLQIVADSAFFDYSETDASFRRLVVSYDKHERKIFQPMRYTKGDKEEQNGNDETCEN